MKKTKTLQLWIIIAIFIVLCLFCFIPYLSGKYMVCRASSSHFWYKGARLNEWAAFQGAKKSLEDERVLRGFSLYYFYMIAKGRNEKDRLETSRIIRINASNIRDVILSTVLENGDLRKNMSQVDLDHAMARDKPIRMIINDYMR